MSVCPIVRHKSIRLSRMSQTRARHKLAPRRVQNVTDSLSRDLMMVLHNSFDHARTDEEMLFPKVG